MSCDIEQARARLFCAQEAALSENTRGKSENFQKKNNTLFILCQYRNRRRENAKTAQRNSPAPSESEHCPELLLAHHLIHDLRSYRDGRSTQHHCIPNCRASANLALALDIDVWPNRATLAYNRAFLDA